MRESIREYLGNVKRGDSLVEKLLRYIGVVIAAFSAVIMLMGGLTLLQGFLIFFGFHHRCVELGSGEDLAKKTGTAFLTEALEYFLLAPLPYLIVRTLGTYFRDLRDSEDGIVKPKTLKALMSVKAFSCGLLIAILSTHLVGELLENPAESFDVKKSLCGSGLLLALTIYFGFVERSSKLEETKND